MKFKMNNQKIKLMLASICVLILFNNESRTQDYYPLQIGNRWDYIDLHFDPITFEVDTSYFSVEIIGNSLFPNGELYYIFNSYDITGGKYVRGDSRFIYYYDEYPQAEEDTLYRLISEVGESWEVLFPPVTHVTLEVKDTVWIFSNLTTILGFELDGLMVFYITLSEKFGPVKFFWTGEPPGTDYREKILIGCIIDSVIYGNLVSVKSEQFPPKGFSLLQNYPNPFNPSTTISFEIPEGSFVTIKVYDILGNEIATLVNEEKPLGSYEAEFNANNLPSGIYFYTLSTGNFLSTKKMILLK